ncbi:MAG TPA: hypothetical protein VK009_05380 [Chloroflexota bacterium]|nr:hypothetical protein [Chloroflexota bacterium]
MAHVPIYQPTLSTRVRRMTVRQRLALLAAAGVPLALAGSALGYGWSAASAQGPTADSGHFATSDQAAHLADILSGRISLTAARAPSPSLSASPAPAPAPAPAMPQPAQPVFATAEQLPALRPVALTRAIASPTRSTAPQTSAVSAAPVTPASPPAAPSSPSPEPSPHARPQPVRELPHPTVDDQPHHATAPETHVKQQAKDSQDGHGPGKHADRG